MTYDKNNIFAKILRKEVPCDMVYEDHHTLAFYDIAPKAKIHVLVIPKGEYLDIYNFLNSASSEEISGYFQGLQKVIEQLNLTENGFRVTSNSGVDGKQEVPHFHTHIFGGEPLSPCPRHA